MTILKYDDSFGTHTLAFYHVDEMFAFIQASPTIRQFNVIHGKYVPK